MYICLLFWFEHHFYILSKVPVFSPNKMLHMKSMKTTTKQRVLVGVEGPLHEVHRFSDQTKKHIKTLNTVNQNECVWAAAGYAG